MKDQQANTLLLKRRKTGKEGSHYLKSNVARAEHRAFGVYGLGEGEVRDVKEAS